MPDLQLEQISCLILKDISLRIASGEAVALLGPSGSGKSTLLKVIAGLLRHEGLLRIDGEQAEHLPAYKRSLGYVSQDLHLFPHLTVRGNVGLPLLFGWKQPHQTRATRRKQIDETLALAHASHLAVRYPARLSGGERQRVALARSLARRPKLLLLDEPFSSLDGDTKRELWVELTGLRQALDLTLVLVTHDREEAEALSDRTISLRDGRLEPETKRSLYCLSDRSGAIAR